MMEEPTLESQTAALGEAMRSYRGFDLPGIDMLFFGPADFSQGIGAPNSADPRIDETRRLVAKVARKHGKFAGTVGGPANFDSLVEMGYTFISTGADVVALWKYFKEINEAVRDRNIAEV